MVDHLGNGDIESIEKESVMRSMDGWDTDR
jgi:hypothetical protein